MKEKAVVCVIEIFSNIKTSSSSTLIYFSQTTSRIISEVQKGPPAGPQDSD